MRKSLLFFPQQLLKCTNVLREREERKKDKKWTAQFISMCFSRSSSQFQWENGIWRIFFLPLIAFKHVLYFFCYLERTFCVKKNLFHFEKVMKFFHVDKRKKIFSRRSKSSFRDFISQNQPRASELNDFCEADFRIVLWKKMNTWNFFLKPTLFHFTKVSIYIS